MRREASRKGEGEALLLARLDEDFESERLAARVRQRAAAQGIAGLSQEVEGAARQRPVASRTVGGRRGPPALHDVVAHGAGEGREQRALQRRSRPPGRGQFAVVEEAARALVDAGVEIGVDPFEIEHRRQGLAHPRVGENRAAGVEGEAGNALGQAIGNRQLADAPVARGGKIIAAEPARRIVLDAEIIEPGLEGFEHRRSVAVIVDADFIEIVEPARRSADRAPSSWDRARSTTRWPGSTSATR